MSGGFRAPPFWHPFGDVFFRCARKFWQGFGNGVSEFFVDRAGFVGRILRSV